MLTLQFELYSISILPKQVDIEVLVVLLVDIDFVGWQLFVEPKNDFIRVL